MSETSTGIAPHVLEVRPILKSGGEPFQAIMQAVQGLQPVLNDLSKYQVLLR